MSRALRVGVPRHLLMLAPSGGHGKVWHRVLGELRHQTRIVELGGRRRSPALRWGRIDVVLASGHDDLPAATAPLVVQVHEAGWFTPELRDLLGPDFLAHIAPRTERAVHSADRVIAPSQRARLDLIEQYGLEAAKVC